MWTVLISLLLYAGHPEQATEPPVPLQWPSPGHVPSPSPQDEAGTLLDDEDLGEEGTELLELVLLFGRIVTGVFVPGEDAEEEILGSRMMVAV